jgi:hypothetical protein
MLQSTSVSSPSDSRRRDNAIRRRWLESEKYAQAVFSPPTIQGLPETYVDGREMPLQGAGSLRDSGRDEAGHGRAPGGYPDRHYEHADQDDEFGFEPPSILGMLKAEDRVVLDLQFTARHTVG